MKQSLIKSLNNLKVVEFKKVRLRDGKESDYYINIKKAYGYPEIKARLGDKIYSLMDKSATCVAGSGYGGIPIASYLSTKYNIKLALVRNSSKNHGLKDLIDGYIPNESDKIAIVDDVFSTGSSLRDTISNLKPTKAKVICCYVVVKRGEGVLPVELKYLLTSEELIKR
ncbi:MAG: phosphoribosyltransferase family protein [Nanoarchaeota archaeon]